MQAVQKQRKLRFSNLALLSEGGDLGWSVSVDVGEVVCWTGTLAGGDNITGLIALAQLAPSERRMSILLA